MQCVILAGGLGTRMRPLTDKLPKTLLPVHRTPFAHHQLSWLADHGVTNVVYSIAVLGEMVEAAVGDGSQWDLHVDYVRDGAEPLGTGGALRRVLDAGVLEPKFLVLYGDSFLPFDFRDLFAAFESQDRPAMMAVFANQGRYDQSNVVFADGVVRRYEKGVVRPDMTHIDYGVAALDRAVVEQIPPGERSDLATLYHHLSVSGRLAAFEVFERFYEIGSPAGLADFEEWLARRQVAV
jgi:NDP-sugar pyrophosphorylase family protein